MTMLPGIKLMIKYNRIVGITLSGLTYHGEKLSKWKIWLLRLWNVAVVIIIAICGYTSFKLTMDFHLTNTTRSDNATFNISPDIR